MRLIYGCFFAIEPCANPISYEVPDTLTKGILVLENLGLLFSLSIVLISICYVKKKKSRS